MLTKPSILIATLMLGAPAIGFGQQTTKFTVRIDNVTKPDAFTASNGVKWSLGFSPGVAVVHTDKGPIFAAGKKDRGKGLEHNPRKAIQVCSPSR
jgi:hypothetical protein